MSKRIQKDLKRNRSFKSYILLAHFMLRLLRDKVNEALSYHFSLCSVYCLWLPCMCHFMIRWKFIYIYICRIFHHILRSKDLSFGHYRYWESGDICFSAQSSRTPRMGGIRQNRAFDTELLTMVMHKSLCADWFCGLTWPNECGNSLRSLL